MGEKSNSESIEIIQLDKIQEYVEKLLNEQTAEIIKAFNKVDEERQCDDIQKLKSQLDQAEKQYAQLERKVDSLQEQNEKLAAALKEERSNARKKTDDWEQEKEKLISKIDEYENKYACIDKVYSCYIELPEKIKRRITNIFANGNLYSIIVAVSDWKGIEGIWGFTKRRIIEDENEGIAELISLFEAAFHMFTLTGGNEKYELITPKVGERYDSDRHSIKGIKTDGIIKEVLLSGIYDSVSNKTMLKAVVQIQ